MVDQVLPGIEHEGQILERRHGDSFNRKADRHFIHNDSLRTILRLRNRLGFQPSQLNQEGLQGFQHIVWYFKVSVSIKRCAAYAVSEARRSGVHDRFAQQL